MVIHETLYEHCEKMNQGSACMKERRDNHRTHKNRETRGSIEALYIDTRVISYY
jgi:hypothetical protein